MERRATVRIRCHIYCQLALDEGARTGTIVDLSTGGIGLLTSQPIQEGEAVRVKLAPRGGKPIEVDTLVWHARCLRTSRFAIGLVISEPSADYFDTIQALSEQLPVTPKPDGLAPSQTSPEPANTSTFSIRARQRDSSRTRTLYVDARSLEEAHTRALQALGSEWALLEADRR